MSQHGVITSNWFSKSIRRSIATIAAILLGGLAQGALVAEPVSELMPRTTDYTSMWWAEGFPHVVPGAPWLRCIRTGNYGMVMNTESMEITRLGAVSDGMDYQSFGRCHDISWEGMLPADLTLRIVVNGKAYSCVEGGKWDRLGGPRLVESGRFFQRGDITNLVFQSADGQVINVDARFETAAWADRLGLILDARPGTQMLLAGDASFGKVGGGFGLDGTNEFEIPHSAEIDPQEFTLALWVYLPADLPVGARSTSWLACKNSNESANGNYGITMQRGVPTARLNIGGGREGQFTVVGDTKKPLKPGAWSHLAMNYNGDVLRLFVNGRSAGERKIGLRRVTGNKPLVFGRRGDNHGDGFHFRGVVDEIRVFDRALTGVELSQEASRPSRKKPRHGVTGEWGFRQSGIALESSPREKWNDGAMEITLAQEGRKQPLVSRENLSKRKTDGEWQRVSLVFDPVTFEKWSAKDPVRVSANEVPEGKARPVEFDPDIGWHRVNLDGIEPIAPARTKSPSNDAIERVKLVLTNPSSTEQVARLMFEKSAGGIRQRIGSAITGISAMLRDEDGNPTGIPVQLSKNWHTRPDGGVYSGTWFHGVSQVRLPPETTATLELTVSYGHWGGVPAASHAQLCLIGWGSNQHWSQSALGAWGESICYEPEQGQANCSITDVRPLMVNSGKDGKKWSWTTNVGGGDFLRLFDIAGERVGHSAMRTTYLRQGPCLTEVIFSGKVGRAISHSETVSLSRTDDIVRSIYQIRMKVNQPVDFSRFTIFQVGADTYNFTQEKRLAIGNDGGLIREWSAQWGGNTYRMEPVEWSGRSPWASLHEAVPRDIEKYGATANRGLILRSWKARLGGKPAWPFIAERGVEKGGRKSSLFDILPPPELTRLEIGDYVEATIEHIVVPQGAESYYGPNEALRTALGRGGNTWKMIAREAAGNDREVKTTKGSLQQTFPDVRVEAEGNSVEFTLSGGLGYVPITFTGLSSDQGFELLIDGKSFDQGVHGNDFWQCDYNAADQSWSRTYNIPCAGKSTHLIQFGAKP